MHDRNVHIDLNSFVLMVFQPEGSFYYKSFDVRLDELTKSIKKAQDYLVRNGFVKGIFIAPEYLFKDLSKEGGERYFSHEQKKIFIDTLSSLSVKFNRLILAPGTICWHKPSKALNESHYRNELFFFYKGEVQKYKKTFPHQNYDYDFLKNRDVLKLFKSGINDSCLIDIGGLSIVVEICFDHQNKRMQMILDDKDKISKVDMHLIVADRLPNINLINHPGILTVKIERQPDLSGPVKNIIGTNAFDRDGKIGIVEAALTAIDDEAALKCYQFLRVPELNSTAKIVRT